MRELLLLPLVRRLWLESEANSRPAFEAFLERDVDRRTVRLERAARRRVHVGWLPEGTSDLRPALVEHPECRE